MNKIQATGITRVIKAAGYSRSGLISAWKNEAAFRQECILCIVAIVIAFGLNINPTEKILLISSVVLVIIVELLNSAIEAVVDRIGYDRHELSGRAKDIASAAVFVSLILAALVWSIILYHWLFH